MGLKGGTSIFELHFNTFLSHSPHTVSAVVDLFGFKFPGIMSVKGTLAFFALRHTQPVFIYSTPNLNAN